MHVGDYVIGTDNAPYTITTSSCLCRVVGFRLAVNTILVKVTQPNSSHNGRVFEVNHEYFGVVKKCESTSDTSKFKEGDIVRYTDRASVGRGGYQALHSSMIFEIVNISGDSVDVMDISPLNHSRFIIHADYLQKVLLHNNLE